MKERATTGTWRPALCVEAKGGRGMEIRLMQGDVLERLRALPDGCAHLAIADPPYNTGGTMSRDGRRVPLAWDRIDGYADWCLAWVRELRRVLSPRGVLYLWQGDMAQAAQVMEILRRQEGMALRSFCIWDKGPGYRARSWAQRDPDGPTAPRCWVSRCEYCLHYFAQADHRSATGLERINSNPACYASLKRWYRAELQRLGLTQGDVARAYTRATGRAPHMLRHYFCDSQFEIPTREIWEGVYRPLGFAREHESLRREYEGLRREYEGLRPAHRCDAGHCNVWSVPPVPTTGRLHPCQKPVELLRRMIRVSSRPGDVILDPFMGSGSAGVAAMEEGRAFMGIERDARTFETARRRIGQHAQQRSMEDVMREAGGP